MKNPQVKIKLLEPKSIRGEMLKKGDVVEVHEGVANWLIERKAAEKTKKVSS